jgi:addiction module HigA family antidote
MEMIKNPHPGEMLKEDFLEPLGMTPEELAQKIDLPMDVVRELINGERSITPDFALRLSRYIGTSAQFWIGLQRAYDESELKRADPKAYEHIQPREQAA